MAHFILIAGPPASGKTHFLNHVRENLLINLPFFSKDDMKEILFETIGAGDIRLSQKQGAASWDLLMLTMEQLSRGGGTYIFEGNFKAHHRMRFEEIERETSATFDQLLFTASPEVLGKRSEERNSANRRHTGHADSERDTSIEAMLKILDEEASFASLGGKTITVNTTELNAVDYSEADKLFTSLEQQNEQ